MNRRELFREYIKRLNTTAAPKSALDAGFFVPWPGTPLAEEMGGRLSINPGSAHLLYGSVGTGKTTQLLKTEEFLNQQPNTKAIYVDVSQHNDGGEIEGGVEFADLVLDLVEDALHKKGMPKPTNEFDLTTDRLNFFRKRVPSDVIFLIDSLERLTRGFDVLAYDLEHLKAAGIGLVVAGSYHSFEKDNASFLGLFDHQFHQYIPTPNQSEDRAFLAQVLRCRADVSILPNETISELVTCSGGVLRDLISLARASGEEAYVQGSNQISPAHARAAALRFGDALMMSFSQDDIDKLRHIKNTGKFHSSLSRDEYFPLLSARCILQYQGPSYKVHPAILLHLEKVAA